MTEQDKINAELKLKVNLQDTRYSLTMQELRQHREELKEQREDIRRLNAKIDSKFDKLSDQIHTMTIAAVVGFGAITVAVGGLIVAALK